jgi:hypothetical protein
MDQPYLASEAFLVGILMGFCLAFILMAWIGSTEAKKPKDPPK